MQIIPKPATIAPGVGRIVLDTHGSDAVFSELSYAYPLKLLSPRLHQPKVAVAYVVSYGGGLVGGDQVEVSAEIKNDAVLVMLTQVRSLVLSSDRHWLLTHLKRIYRDLRRCSKLEWVEHP